MRNLILTGGIFHPFETAAPALDKILEEQGIESVVTEDMESGLRELAAGSFDMLTVYALRWRMLGNQKYDQYREQWAYSPSAEARQAVVSHLESGGGLFGLHTAAICFDDWPEWGSILGATWVWGQSGHPPFGPTMTRLDDPNHTFVRGLEAFTIQDEVYGGMDLEADVVPLMSAKPDDVDGKWQPMLWRRNWRSGRVAFDALGHDAQSLNHPTHREILARAARWVAGLDQ